MGLTDDAQTMQQVLHIHRLIRDRIGQNAMKRSLQPLWYRGLSDNQLAAAHGLKRALGDDILQGSAHRAHHQLCHLGVYPRPPRRGLRLLLMMSRGNDVAFLWFLMEMFYKSENQKVIYQFNEQIIMSAIFWLDLFPTLHELDRVLPLPHDSAAVRQKRAQAADRRFRLKNSQRIKSMKKQSKELLPQQPHPKSVHKLPYFQQPVLPNPRQQRLIAHASKRPARFPTVQPDLVRYTITSRWFGDLNRSDGERIARSVLYNEIDQILSNLPSSQSGQRQLKPMNLQHKLIGKMEQSLHSNLERIKKQRYEQFLNIDHQQRELTRQRTLNELDRMTERYRAQFHEMAMKAHVGSNRKGLIEDPNDPGFIYLGNNEADWMDDTSCGLGDTVVGFNMSDSGVTLPHNCRDNSPKKVGLKKRQNEQSFRVYDGDARLPEKQDPRQSERSSLQLGDTNMEEDRAQTQEPSPCQCTSQSNYFELGPDARPYRFDYQKLFAPYQDRLLDDQELRLKVEFIKALDNDANYLNAVLNGRKCGSIDTLVNRTAKRIFKEGTDLFQDIYAKSQAETEVSEPGKRINFGRDFFDADDHVLMKDMLRIGLQRVAQDRRFVLPTLPDVHCVPMLLEWICARYGKRYSQADRKRSFNEAKHLMDNLVAILAHGIVRTPNREPLKSKVTAGGFVAHNANRPNMKKFWDQYTKHFVVSFLEMGRVFHAAMDTHQSTQTSATYYAYMPAHLNDVQFCNTTPIINRGRTKM
ncbi:uncharacterized protein [Drosophila virilis]|uniref:Uncharacterized protein n=1 Tax=Drosophila virilis TaxID=7244 RepID=B4M5X3_DROVI|nr:uncharacterized protein LOC6633020 [Drosophila virilis]EDW59049.1 uncharacterized protein Dvir_GJ10498 [Drosophila virilis]